MLAQFTKKKKKNPIKFIFLSQIVSGTGELDHYLPDKTKVSLIPNTNLPVLPTATDVGPTNPPDEVDKNAPADPCSSHIDAITVFRTEIFLFIGKVRHCFVECV